VFDLDNILAKTKGKILKSPHFWAILFITLFLVFIYQAWPWRTWKFEEGIWQWFSWLSPLYAVALTEVINHVVGILFLVPIIYAAVVFSWQGALVAFMLALIGVMPIATDIWSTSSLITNVILLLLPVLIASIVAFELAWRRKERKNFAVREAERKVYISKILESQENERLRIAQEIHDDTIQTLLVIANAAQSLVPEGKGDMAEVKKKAEWIRDATLQAIEELRRTSLDLRPSVLDDLGLVPALRWLVDNANKESDTNTRILIKGAKRKLLPQAEVTIFRIVQEALNNIKRHSKAKKAVVSLEFDTECLRITIRDNGRGFHPPKKFDRLAAKGKLGLIGMQQRIDFLGGTFQIRSHPGGGTSLLIEANC
jgi:two-component system sensor histidine kinase DegS